jgi:PAS domain S-box-containing protein
MASPSRQIAGEGATRVLVAEGDHVSLMHVRQLLTKSGYDVVTAQDGLQALQMLESENAPRLAVLDWQMPGLNGIDICQELRKAGRRQSSYVILLTPWNQQNDRVEGLKAGADDCLYKPVDVRELRIRLQIGAQVMLERALRESEDRFRGAFECAGTGMALVKLTGDFLQVNRALCDFLGYAPEELLTASLHTIVYHEDQPTIHTLLERLLSGERTHTDFERRFVKKDGATAWGSFTISVMLDADEHAVGLVVQVHDITERKQAAAALQRSEAFSRAITDNAQDLIMVVNAEQTWLYANPSHFAILGYTPDELIGINSRTIIHPDDLDRVQRAATAVSKDGQARMIEVRFRHKNGTWRHMESHDALMRSTSGALEGIVVTSRPIDDRILAEQTLQAAYAETELFLNSIPSILIGLDGTGRVTRWNRTAAKALGMQDHTVMGKTLDNCGIKWGRIDMKSEVGRWLATDAVYRCDSLTYERDGETRFLALNVIRIPAEDNKGARFIVTGADVTERKLLEEQLRQAQKLEAIGQLAAGVAHEINTPTQYIGDNARFLKDSWEPIAGLLNLCRAMRQEGADGPVSIESLSKFDRLFEQADLEYLLKEIPQAIEQSLDGVQRVAKIVRAMKEFSHPGSQEKSAVDVNKAIETTITVARNEWRYVAEMVTHLDENLPLAPCLAGELNQVILNLIVNAAHAIAEVVGESTEKKGNITITTSHKEGWVEIAISDTGSGIPEEIRSRIFEPFFTTKTVGKGTGQGLTLAHSLIVKRHQGQLWFETETGKGTTFFIRLPLEARPSVP